ncbi:MAG: flagellin [Pirellulaceae bacterium]
MLGLANNVGALNARHNLTRSSMDLNKSIERLSSGFKINRGSDGPAALVISEKQRAQIAGLRQAIDNTEKGVAVVQTAEGALNEINSLLTKVRSLALDSANAGVNDDDALAANQAEIDNALETITRIANNTQYGEKNLLDGSAGFSALATDSDITVQGVVSNSSTASGNHAVNITTAAERAKATGSARTAVLASAETLTINGVQITLDAGLSQAQTQARINEFTAQTGVVAENDPSTATATRLRTTEWGSAASISVVSNVAAGGASSGFGTTEVTDTGVDIAGTIGGAAATGTGNVLTSTAGGASGTSIQVGAATDVANSATGAQGYVSLQDNSLVFQVGANQNQTVNVAVDAVNATALGVGVANNQFANLNSIDVTTASGSQDALGVIDAAIDQITNLRGKLGAFQQNTLESTANNMRTTLENTVNAESVIRDTDFAEEISNMTNKQVLVQAGTSVLSTANQSSQLILSLLR